MYCKLVLACALLTSAAVAEQTSDTYHIGGPGSFGSNGSSDPGTLSNGTEAAAEATLEFDDQTGILILTVDNTSPVVEGQCNPALTDIFFNTPLSVTDVMLNSQVGSGGATPDFELIFDADLGSNPNPNGAGSFGVFNVGLHNQNIEGGIANPSADTIPGPPGSLVTGPVVFTFSLTGSLVGLTAADFTNTFSGTPPGNHPSTGAAKFQGGGADCDGSGFINDVPEECMAIVGLSQAGGTFHSPMITGNAFPTQLSNIRMYQGVTLNTPLMIRLPDGPARHMTRTDGTHAQGATAGTRMFVQVVMWNPDQFAGNPEQSTNGLELAIFSDGTYTATPYGSSDGMNLQCQTVTMADGRRFAQLAFTINGI